MGLESVWAWVQGMDIMPRGPLTLRPRPSIGDRVHTTARAGLGRVTTDLASMAVVITGAVGDASFGPLP